MKRVLLTEPIHEDAVNLLKNEYELKIAHTIDEKKLINIVEKYSPEAIITKLAPIPEQLIEVAPKLEIIGKHGVGYDNIDVQFARKNNIMVTHVPYDNADSVSEFTITLILSLLKKLPSADQDLKNGNWIREKWIGTELLGKSIGIVGVGNIGRKVAEKLVCFGVKLIGYDPNVKDKLIKCGNAEIQMVSFEDLLSHSDIVTIHVPFTSGTKNMFNRKTFYKMKRGACLINVSRGGVVNERDLYECLEEQQISSAGLDVFETEPKQVSFNHPLLALNDRVLLTPHIAANTLEAQRRIAVTVVKDIIYGLKEGEATHLVPELKRI